MLCRTRYPRYRFPFLFGGTFIEAFIVNVSAESAQHFPSFSEGLSLRLTNAFDMAWFLRQFPFLFGGTFIEAQECASFYAQAAKFPFLFGGTFIEGRASPLGGSGTSLFPFLFEGTFIEGCRRRRWRR